MLKRVGTKEVLIIHLEGYFLIKVPKVAIFVGNNGVRFLLKSVGNVNEPYREVRWALVAKERPDMFLDSSVEERPD